MQRIGKTPVRNYSLTSFQNLEVLSCLTWVFSGEVMLGVCNATAMASRERGQLHLAGEGRADRSKDSVRPERFVAGNCPKAAAFVLVRFSTWNTQGRPDGLGSRRHEAGAALRRGQIMPVRIG